MQLYNYFNSKMRFVGALILLIGVSSCGSYQYAGYEDDSIYGTSQRPVEQQEVVTTEVAEASNSDYYQNYFKERSIELENHGEDAIFTDIDSYQTTNDSLDYQGNAGWGYTQSDNATITIYNNQPWGFGFWGDWRWNFRNSPYYWNYGIYDPFWCPPFYASYWNRPYWRYGYYNYPYYGHYGWNNNFYYGNNYYNRYYNRRGLAYNTGRRGAVYSRTTPTTIGRRSTAYTNTTSRRSSAIRSNATRSSSGTTATRSRRSATIRSNGDYRVNTRPRSTSTRVRSTTNSRPRRTTTTRPRTTTRSSTTTRSRSSSNRSNSSYNRSSSSSRSSSTVRSSGSSSRSSSASRSSGSRSSSRRNN